jgi:ABC-type polysaccharide/polyol phosphate transport system ATPase subunit
MTLTDPAPLPAIEVEGLSTSYRIHVGAASAWSGFLDLVRRTSATDRVVPAVRDVTFEVEKGSVMCIIGRNGAGKSTLLRCLAGILAPEKGRVTARGRITSLLSVGIGMNPKLTGRENIRLGGLAIGLEERRLDEITGDIAEFAQLGEYIDYPVDTYSMGMRSRLGFSVAAHLDPEILLIDEALTGGDSKFKDLVADKMTEMCSGGRTIVLVTHGLTAVLEMATTAMWMHQGRLVELGDPDDVVASYMRYCRLADLRMDMDD